MLKKEVAPPPVGKFYLKVQEEMDKKYKDAVILMEIGKFYEVYTFENPKTGKEIGRAKEMSRICNIQLTRKNKNVALSMSNPHMCGFPSHSLPRFVSHLVENGKTVVVYDQCGDESGKVMERKIKAIYSPSVMVGLEEEEIQEKDRSILAVETISIENQILVILVHINTSSGKIMFEEECLDEPEARSFIQSVCDLHDPSEILYKGILSDLFSQNRSIHPIPDWTKENRKFAELEFQLETLNKIYKGDRHISVIEEIGLERHPDVLPLFCFSLSFLYDHLPLVLYRIEKPVRLSRSGVVCFHPNTLYDLNIFSKHNEHKSLFGILDQTITPGGKKLLRKKLFSPIYDSEKLESCYEEISHYLSLPQEPNLKKSLTYYHIDLEHHFRRLQMGNIRVLSLYRLLTSCIELKTLLGNLQGLKLTQHAKELENDWQEMIQDAVQNWDLNLMQSWKSWETSSIWKCTPPSLIELEDEWLTIDKNMKNWIRSEFGSEMIRRLTFTDEEAYFQVTKKMFVEMKRPEGIRHKTMNSGGTRIFHKNLDDYCKDRRTFLYKISSTRKALFQEEGLEFLQKHENTLRFVLEFSAKLDVLQCYAQNAKKYKLVRPQLYSEQKGINCHQVRHLVVEVANPQSKYIPNDVHLSRMLLFGQNSAGKCFKKGTRMVRWNGTFCKVEDLLVGDQLIGDDGNPRTILALTSGEGKLYEIVNENNGDILMTVNEEHILCLTDPDRSKILEKRVKDIMENPKSSQGFMFQCTAKPVGYKFTKPPITPFILNEKNRIHYTNLLKQGFRLILDENKVSVLPSTEEIIPFIIRPCGTGEFYGFGVDGNQRFVLPDGTLAHNSTLMKSVGISVLMAQAGMFVPCSEMIFSPIKSLFTKIGTRDDIWKGKSTFITEMTELRYMLDRCDENSLLLCDEPTSGTETFSATGIVASALSLFMEKKSMFIMTTHLHTLKNFKELMEDPRLQVKHLGMEFDAKKKKLQFDRILRDGYGKSIYGLEIAEYLGFSVDFLKKAYEYRSRLETEPTNPIPKKRSRYNSKKWVEQCEECGCKDNLHTHHIEHQANADKDGYIGTSHKNRLSNLKVLCRDCHHKEHDH